MEVMYVLDTSRVTVRGREKKAISGPADVWLLLKRRFGKRDKEHFIIVPLDARHQVLGVEVVSVGTLNASIVHPREVFRIALRENAASLVICHNHPSGDSTPSDDDVAITRRLVQVGELHGIPILDHIVITTTEWTSFREKRLL